MADLTQNVNDIGKNVRKIAENLYHNHKNSVPHPYTYYRDMR